MQPNRLAQWELRVGTHRVYYDVEEDQEPIVRIRAVGVKVRNKVYIEGKQVDL
jgi:hypothetical protein